MTGILRNSQTVSNALYLNLNLTHLLGTCSLQSELWAEMVKGSKQYGPKC